jgi:hypothetical protein
MHDGSGQAASMDAVSIIPQELPSPSTAHKRKEQFFAETQFDGANLKRSVHLGWGAAIGAPLTTVGSCLRSCLQQE